MRLEIALRLPHEAMLKDPLAENGEMGKIFFFFLILSRETKSSSLFSRKIVLIVV